MSDASIGSGLANSLRAAVADRVGEGRFGLWFGEEVKLEVTGDRLEVGVPNNFFRDWIRGHFTDSLLEAGHAVTGRSLSLNFLVGEESASKSPQADASASRLAPSTPARPDAPQNRLSGQFTDQPAAPQPSSPTTRPQAGANPTHARTLRRFDDFVTGANSRLAHAAAMEFVHTAGATFNPLVIHGGVGLGKTHLLEAIGHGFRTKRPGAKVTHVTAENFTNGFLEALRQGSLNSFRSRHRNVDALIVDDVHFIAPKRATQDEFLHTFNALLNQGVPIVLATDQHPRQVSRLTEELATRFLGGMVVKLDAPDPATRKAILKAKALARGVDVPDSVLAFIADHLRASVRELEGALNSVIAHATFAGKRLDLALAKSALRDTIRHTSRALGLKDVEKAVCSLFAIDGECLKSDSRARTVTYPRMIAMYLARKHVGAAYSEIGRHFGGKNHSTVISAEKKVVSWLKDEERIHRLDGFETTSEILAALEGSLGS